jgi:hypothetical protein
MRGILMKSSAVVFLLAASWPARADDVPTLNVQPLCRGIISQGDSQLQAGDRSVTLDECLNAEQVDRETIRKEWPTFSPSDKIHCTAEATMGGESSYTDLLTCLEMARDVRRLKLPDQQNTDVKTKSAH